MIFRNSIKDLEKKTFNFKSFKIHSQMLKPYETDEVAKTLSHFVG